MIRVSSNLTLFLKIILPLTWLIFYGSFSVGFLFLPGDRLEGIGPIWIKYVFWAIFLSGFVLMYFTVIKLKRVEFGPQHVYVSNYQKEFYYDYSDIQSIDERNFGLFKTARIQFKETTSFGQRIVFLLAEYRYAKFIREHPDLFGAFMDIEELPKQD